MKNIWAMAFSPPPDDSGHRADGTRRAGIIWLAVLRRGPWVHELATARSRTMRSGGGKPERRPARAARHRWL